MPLTGKLVGDFSSFKQAVDEAQAKLTTFQSGAGAVEKSLSRMADSLSGKKVIQEATLMAEAIEQLGGVSQLTASELQRVGAQAQEAIGKMNAVGIKNVPTNLQAVATAAQNASKATTSWSSQLATLGTSLIAPFTAANLASSAIQALTVKVGEFVATGQKLPAVSASFDRLTEGLRQNGSQMLSNMSDATKGMVSNYDLMATANKAMLLGLPVTAESMGELAKTATTLGRAMGEDVTKSLDDLITALGRSSPMILDNLGLSVKVGEANEQYARSLGKLPDALTDAEKKTAFYRAAMEAARKKTAELGEQTQTLGEIIARVWTQIGNRVSGATALIDMGVGRALSSTSNFLQFMRDAAVGGLFSPLGVAEAIAKQADRAKRDRGAGGPKAVNETTVELPPTMVQDLKAATAAYTALTAAQRANIDAGFALGKSASDIAKELGVNEAVVNLAKKAHDDLATSLKKTSEEREKDAEAARNVSIAQRGYNAVLDDYGVAVAEALRWELAHGAAIEDLARVYKVAPAYIREVERAIKAEDEALDDWLDHMRQVETESNKVAGSLVKVSYHYDETGKIVAGVGDVIRHTGFAVTESASALEDVSRAHGVAAAAADAQKRSEEALAKQVTSTIGLMPDLSKQASEHMREVTVRTTQWADTLDVVAHSLTNIGGMNFGPLIGQIEAIVRAAERGEKIQPRSVSGREVAGAGIQGGLAGALSIAGGASGGQALGNVGMAAGTAAASAIASGASIAGSVALGAATLGIGAAAVGVALLAKHFLSVSQAEKDARAAWNELQKDYGSMDETIRGVGAAYATMGKSGTEAQRDLKAALDATHVSAEAERKALEPINRVLADAKQRTADVADSVARLGPAFASLMGGTTDAIAGYDDLKVAVDSATEAQKKALVAGDEVGARRAANELKTAIDAQGAAAQRAGRSLNDLGVQAVAVFAAQVAGGKSVASTLADMGPSLATLKQGYDDLGLSVDNVALSHLLMQANIANANPQLMQAVGGLTSEMDALAKMGLLNVDTFEAMERTGADMYERLQASAAAAGGTTKDALIPMQEWLHKAATQAEELGIPLDDNTQRMVDQSKELGIWKATGKDATKALTDSVGDLVSKMDELIGRLAGPGGVVDAINAIPRNVDVAVSTRVATPTGYQAGGVVQAPGFAQGGLAPDASAWGAPSGTDNVRAWLTPGERVLTVADTKTFDAAGGVEALREGALVDFQTFIEAQKATRDEVAKLRADMATTWPSSIARAMRDQVAQGGRRR